MNPMLKQAQGIGQTVLIGLFLLSSCSPRPDGSPFLTEIPGAPPEKIQSTAGSWQVIGVYDASHNIMTAGFLDEHVVATGGVGGEMGYSSDGAQTWLVTNSMADCRYGMDILNPRLIWSCGGATHVRRSMDGGKTWQVLAAFGDPRTIRGACHSASFLDENTGWLANSNMFGTTTDGGATWTLRSLHERVHKIATIDTYLPGEGYLLDKSGTLFFTRDDGEHWSDSSRLDLGSLEMVPSAYQLAAMRFTDAEHGLIVISASPFGEARPVLAFHTSNGGKTWTSEPVPVLAGPVYLAREGGYLTVITGANQITLLKYEEHPG